ncbi:MAG: AI-2E family transporter [Solirubrobacteraceae bacterium]|nr:AI-2E family transporter [Solirubrobacteraceae bacterium]
MEAPGTPAGPQVPDWLEKAAAWSWRALVIAGVAAVAIFVLWHLRVVWAPFFIALLFATVLLPITDWLNDHGLPRALAVAVSMLIFVVGLGLLITLVVGSIVGEASQVGKLVTSGAGKVAEVTQPQDGPLALDRDSVRGLVADLGSGLKAAGDAALKKAASDAGAAVAAVVGGVMAIAFLIYLLSDSQGIRDWMRSRAGTERGRKLDRAIDECWETLGSYMRGTFLVAVFVSVLIGIAAFALGLPIAGTLVAITFFASFIPIVGAWLAGLIVVLTAFAGGGVDAGIIMVAVQVVVHSLESLFVAPRAYQKTLNLNPIVILASVTAGTALMGIIGALIVVPLVAIVWVLIKEFRREHDGSPPATAPPSPASPAQAGG